MSILNFTPLGDELTCFGQIDADHLPLLVQAGYRSIICNRPDDEEGAVSSAKLAAAAQALGLAFVHQPVGFSTMGASDAQAFAEALKALPKPVFAYCRTGRRSAALWAYARASTLGVDAVLAASRAQGCDIDELRPRLVAQPWVEPTLTQGHAPKA